MMLVPCPWCGPRDAAEFGYGGEARPGVEAAVPTPGQWRGYLYLRRNPAGWATEHWYHRYGCRRWLTVQRHTVTNEIRSVEDTAGAGGTP